MAIAVTTLITRIKDHVPSITTAVALELINEAYREITDAFTTSAQASDEITTVADGTREYDLDDDIGKILRVEWHQSASDIRQLVSTNVDDMDKNTPDWRNTTSTGKPSRFFVRSVESTRTTVRKIGFDPIPDTDVSGGYPKAVIYHTTVTDLQSGDNLPEDTLKMDPYIYHTLWKYKEAREEWDAAERFRALYEQAKHKQIRRSKSIIVGEKTKFKMSGVGGSRVV
jgi:hypothetical protein